MVPRRTCRGARSPQDSLVGWLRAVLLKQFQFETPIQTLFDCCLSSILCSSKVCHQLFKRLNTSLISSRLCTFLRPDPNAQDSGVWESLLQLKHYVGSESKASDFKESVDSYLEAVDSGGGGLMIAVHRGKVRLAFDLRKDQDSKSWDES